MKNFAVFGVGGYVAPRHLKAIKETGNQMVAAYDKSDSVGIIDSYFPEAAFFTEMELFDRHVSKLKHTDNKGEGFEWATVCTPNYLHDAHTRYALRLGTDVICEKPLVLNPWNVDVLQTVENETGKRVYNILQLRLHPAIKALKEKVDSAPDDTIYDVDLTYITSRGNWYFTSWKGAESKSGGIATNIGIHFYDMLCHIFGKVQENIVHIATHDRVAGFIRFDKARVRYFLSINWKMGKPPSGRSSSTASRSNSATGSQTSTLRATARFWRARDSGSTRCAPASKSSMTSAMRNLSG